MSLERVDLKELGFTSLGLVRDKTLEKDQIVASIIYCKGGDIIYLHREGYKPLELLIAGEKYIGETFMSNRYKIYKVVREEGDKNKN